MFCQIHGIIEVHVSRRAPSVTRNRHEQLMPKKQDHTGTILDSVVEDRSRPNKEIRARFNREKVSSGLECALCCIGVATGTLSTYKRERTDSQLNSHEGFSANEVLVDLLSSLLSHTITSLHNLGTGTNLVATTLLERIGFFLAMRFLTVIFLAFFATSALSATLPVEHPAPEANVDWDSFGFGLNGVRTDKMWVDTVPVDNQGNAEYSKVCENCLSPMGTLQLSPTATVLNYGQALFEGMKAFRRMDGSIAMFRPERNALRMQQGAARFLLPAVPTDVFVEAADAVVRANARWVPPFGKGALYLRPLLMGTGEGLGVKPSSESTFCIFCSPVGNYFKGGLKAIRLQAIRGFSRAAPGGSGAVKASGNYAPAFLVQKGVKLRGFDEVLCLDAVT